jgi:dihydrofolate reductase
MKCIAIVAHDKNQLIGNHGKLPWHIPEDFQHFKSSTLGHPIVMGGNTYTSIGRPLPKRRNIVLSRSIEAHDEVEVYPSIESCMQALQDISDSVFIIGGAQVYQQFLDL